MDELKLLTELLDKRKSFKSPEHAESLYVKLYSYKLRWYWWFIFILTFGLGYIVYRKIIRRILKEAGCKDTLEFHRVYGEYKEIYKDIERLNARVEGYSRDNLEKQKRDILRRIGVHEGKLTDEIKAAELGLEEMIRLEGEVKGLKSKIDGLTALCNEKEICIRENKRKDADMEEKLDYLEESLKRAQTRMDVLSLTKKMLERARSDVLLRRMGDFNKKAADYLSLFTQARYNEIKTEINAEGIRFIVYSPEKREWVNPLILSAGTQDQVYLAARIALVSLVTDKKWPPIIMDDPFVSFDHERLNSAMDVCKKIAEEYQVIIFTCTDQYDAYAGNIIRLDYVPQEITAL